MAIRSTNAGRHGASSSSGGGTADDLARDMKASKGRGSSSSGSNSGGRIDYRDPALNGPFYPGTTRQEFRDDPNWRYQHTPGSDRASQVEKWIKDGNPTGKSNSGGGSRSGSTSRTSSTGNRGEGNAKDGYPFGSTTPGYIDYRDVEANGPFYEGTTRQRYRDDPNARKLHTPGSDRRSQVDKYFGRESKGSTSGIHDEWVPPSAEWYAQDEAAQAQRRSEREGQEAQIPGYAEAKAAWEAAKASGDPRATSAALKRALDIRTKGTLQLKDQRALDAFIAQGGTEETYRDRFNRDWPKPKSPLGAYSHGPGSKDWDTRFTNPVPPNTAGGGRSGGGGNDAANTTSQRQSLPDWAKGGANAGNGLANIAGYLGSGGMTEDLPPGASFDMPSNNILSALRPLVGAPTSGGAAKKPTVVRRGGGRTESR